jgi:integrase/recombinase XerD
MADGLGLLTRSIPSTTSLSDFLDQLKDPNHALPGFTDSAVATIDITIKDHFDQLIERIRLERSFNNYVSTKRILSRFQNFIGENVPVNKITPQHIQLYNQCLIQTKLSGCTINIMMGRIRHAFNLAMRADIITSDPFRAHEPTRVISRVKQRLDDQQISDLEKLDLPNSKRKNWLFHARNMYLFSYYNAGIRIGDLMQLRHGNITEEGRLEYEMDKTGHKKSILLNAEAKRIFSIYNRPDAKPVEYIFPILSNKAPYARFVIHHEKKGMEFELRKFLAYDISSRASRLNSSLRDLSKLIGLEKSITFHSARHSFADKARRSMKKEGSKVTMYDIKNAMGHSSIVTTERYMASLDRESLDEAMESIFR